MIASNVQTPAPMPCVVCGKGVRVDGNNAHPYFLVDASAIGGKRMLWVCTTQLSNTTHRTEHTKAEIIAAIGNRS